MTVAKGQRIKEADRIFGVIGPGLAVRSCLESTRLTDTTDFAPNAGLVPFWTAVVPASLSGYLLFDTLGPLHSEI
jgi:hypothetical protein